MIDLQRQKFSAWVGWLTVFLHEIIRCYLSGDSEMQGEEWFVRMRDVKAEVHISLQKPLLRSV